MKGKAKTKMKKISGKHSPRKSIPRVPAPALVPAFGPLQGIRVLSTGSIIAMPHAANMMADFGAEVIHVERPGYGDTYRTLAPFVRGEDGRSVSASWAQDARNRLSLGLELDMAVPESKEIFLGLVRNSDIWFENLVWLDKFGIRDEMCLEANPRLVIVHVSGFGKPEFGGVPEVCDRGSFDMIGQAASGWLNLVGFPDPSPPSLVKPWSSDYFSALTALFAALAGYIHAQKTGRGQSIDVSQFEANARVLSDTFVSFLEAGLLRQRSGNKPPAFQPYDVFKAKDRWVALGAFGPAVYDRFIKALGLDPERYNWKDCAGSIEAVASEKGQDLDRITRAWVAERTAREVEEHMAKYRVPCSIVADARDAFESPHWQARGNFVEYEDQTLGRTIRALGIIPKFSATPGQVWRGAPSIGQDTEAILKTLLGYSDKKIRQLRDKGILQRPS
jgi:crotonobetainyl-CoA:carnitine CoA-transferase CaiB-like acyl-CoA transferase